MNCCASSRVKCIGLKVTRILAAYLRTYNQAGKISSVHQYSKIRVA